MAVVLALVSAICYGVSDFGGGLAARRVPATTVVLLSNGLSLVLAVAAVTLLPGSVYRGSDMAWGAASGVVGVLGVVLLYRGLAIGPMAVIAPLTAVLSAMVPVVVGAARGERPGVVALCGVAIAMPAMALISREAGDRGGSRRGARVGRPAIVAALCAGLSFGGFFVLLAQTGPGGGAWPLVSQRAASVIVMVLVAAATVARRGPPPLTGRTVVLALLAGLTDFTANLAYVLATHRGLLALVAVIASLYPAGTVLLARLVLAERLARHQALGLVLAAVAVGLIAVR